LYIILIVLLYIAILMAETLLAHLQFTVTQSQQKFVYFYERFHVGNLISCGVLVKSRKSQISESNVKHCAENINKSKVT